MKVDFRRADPIYLTVLFLSDLCWGSVSKIFSENVYSKERRRKILCFIPLWVQLKGMLDKYKETKLSRFMQSMGTSPYTIQVDERICDVHYIQGPGLRSTRLALNVRRRMNWIPRLCTQSVWFDSIDRCTKARFQTCLVDATELASRGTKIPFQRWSKNPIRPDFSALNAPSSSFSPV